MFSNRLSIINLQVEQLSQQLESQKVVDIDLAKSSALEIANMLWANLDGATTTLVEKASTKIKYAEFKNRVFPIVPLYVTSICSERCTYCNYRSPNKDVEIERLRLSEKELIDEVSFLVQQKGLRAIELVYATDPLLRVDQICKHIEITKEYLTKNGGGCVGINAEAFDESDYRRFLDCGIDFVVLWQETYDRERYRQVHPGTSKKSLFEYRLDAYERMLAAGIKCIGMGILSGLADWRKDWFKLIAHEDYLKQTYGILPMILGIPRLKPAKGAILQSSPFTPSDLEFKYAINLHNLLYPRVIPFVNTREDWEFCLRLARGGGVLFTLNCSTIPGGYSLGHHGYQFPTQNYDVEIFAEKLRASDLIPIFNWKYDDLTGRRSSIANKKDSIEV